MVYKAIQDDPKHLSSFLHSTPHHILFDCDGLILDTEPIYTTVALASIRQLLQIDHHIEDHLLFPRSLKLKVMGGASEQVAHNMANYLSNTFNIPVSPSDWSSLTSSLEAHHFAQGCPLMPFIRETVNLFKEKGWPIAVATSSSRHTFLIKSQTHSDLFSNFPVITCGDDPDYSDSIVTEHHPIDHRPKVKGKPHPSIFLTARHHLNRSPSLPGVVLEDSPNGVVAALRSGHSCIWVPADDVPPGFGLIDETLKQFESEIPSNLWVYRATSLKELLQ